MEVRGEERTGWTAVEDGEVRGTAHVWTRPDDRTFLLLGRDTGREARIALLREVPPAVDGELHTWIRSGARRLREALEEQGFAEQRREDHLAVDTARAAAWLAEHPGPDVELLGVAEFGLPGLQVLDEELRDDVPGCDGWRWDPTVFRAETLSSAHDDALYRIAVAEGEPLGLVRVWVDADAPRLGLVGVRRNHRGEGIARTLLRAVVDELVAREVPTLVTEADPTNVPIRALLDALGATVTATMVDMVRPA